MKPEEHLRERRVAAVGRKAVRAGQSWTSARVKRAVVSAVVALTLAGCSHNIYVRGVREPGVGRVGTITPLYVELEKGSDDPDRDRALAAKIEQVLIDEGFAIVPEPEAVAHVYFEYDMEDLVQRKYLQAMSGSTSGMKTVPAEGPFVHRLSVSVVRATTNPTMEPASTDVLWVGGAVLNATSVRSPEVVDVLIVALFEHFPEDTGRTLRVPMRFRDSRAEDLRREAE